MPATKKTLMRERDRQHYLAKKSKSYLQKRDVLRVKQNAMRQKGLGMQPNQSPGNQHQGLGMLPIQSNASPHSKPGIGR